MATDFLGQTLNIGDDVIFLNYNRTSADLERGKITKLFPHAAEIGMKRRAEYKIVKILTDACPIVDAVVVTRCKDCKHKGWVQEPCHGKSIDYCRVWDCPLRNLETTFCSYGEPKEGANADDHD